jgi:chromosome segregation ATPase
MKAQKKKTETEIQQLFINRVKLESAIAELRKRTEQIKKENSLQNEHIRRTKHDIAEVNHDIAYKQKEAADLRNEANKNLESTNELSLILKRAIKERIQLSKKKEALVDDYQIRLKLNRGGATEEQSFVAIPEQVALFQRKMSLTLSAKD